MFRQLTATKRKSRTRSRAATMRHRRLFVESLEDRRLLAANSLPGGTSIEVELTDPADGAVFLETAQPIALMGTAAIGEGIPVPNTLLVYVLDVSGSTTGPGGCGGDQNGDQQFNTILDCEIASAIALNEEAALAGNIGEVGVAVFSGWNPNDPNTQRPAAAGDVDPSTTDVQLLASPSADANSNSTPDVVEVLQSARTNPGRLEEFTFLQAGTAYTDYSAGIEAALDIVNSSSLPNKRVIFMSDGANISGADVATLTSAVQASGAIFDTFAVGNSNNITCTTNPDNLGSLQDVAELSDPDGQCFAVGAVAELPDVLPTVLASTLQSLELSVDGGTPIDLSAVATPSLPVDGPASTLLSTNLPILPLGDHEVCLTASGTDAGGEGSVSECVTITINDVPEANDDSYPATEDAPLNVSAADGVLTNDDDVVGAPLTATVLSGPSHGTLSFDPGGSYTYTPDPDFFGSDSFTYEVCDVHGECDSATVNIEVASVNDPPLAGDDAATADEDTSVTVDVQANDNAGPANEDQTLTTTIISGPANGTATVNPDGSITYTPNPDYNGSDSLVYQVCDSGVPVLCDTATVEITINSVVDALIDVKPGNDDDVDPINLGSKGKTPIAILSGGPDNFDATTLVLNQTTFKINGVEVTPNKAKFKDVDGDGDLDLLLHFLTQDLADILSAESTDLVLTAEYGGDAFGDDLGGSDAIKIVPPQG